MFSVLVSSMLNNTGEMKFTCESKGCNAENNGIVGLRRHVKRGHSSGSGCEEVEVFRFEDDEEEDSAMAFENSVCSGIKRLTASSVITTATKKRRTVLFIPTTTL